MAQVLRTLNTSANWSVNPGCPGVTTTTDTCPYFPGETVYQQVLVDGVRATFDPTANERNDLQAGGITRGADRAVECAFKLISYPSNLSSAIWHLIGFIPEVHGNNLPQAVIQPQIRVSTGVGTQGIGNTLNRNSSLPAGEPRLWIDTNAGQEPHRYYDCGPVALDTWVYARMHFRLSTGTDGYIKLYRDDDTSPRVNITGVATTGGTGDYYKEPNYRNSGLSGTTSFRWCGIREWDGLMPNRAAGSTPPPSGTDTTPPTISISQPVTGTTYTNTIPFSANVSDASGLSNVWIGLGGNPIPAAVYTSPSTTLFSGSLDVTQVAPGTYYFYVAAQDNAGNQNSTNFQVTVAAPTSGSQSISGGVIATATVTGDLTLQSTPTITSVAQRGEVVLETRVPRYYEVLADGSLGAELTWNSSSQRFEYAA